MATYGPGIDQLQHAKSVSHIIISSIANTDKSYCELGNNHTCKVDTCKCTKMSFQ